MECSKRKHKLLGLQVVILFLIAGGVLVGKRLVNNNPESLVMLRECGSWPFFGVITQSSAQESRCIRRPGKTDWTRIELGNVGAFSEAPGASQIGKSLEQKPVSEGVEANDQAEGARTVGALSVSKEGLSRDRVGYGEATVEANAGGLREGGNLETLPQILAIGVRLKGVPGQSPWEEAARSGGLANQHEKGPPKESAGSEGHGKSGGETPPGGGEVGINSKGDPPVETSESGLVRNTFTVDSQEEKALKTETPRDGSAVAEPLKEEFACDRSFWMTDVCRVGGTVRIRTESTEVEVYTRGEKPLGSAMKVRPQPRKYDADMMAVRITEFELVSKPLEELEPRGSPQCDHVSDVPGVLFSAGGWTGNAFHEFTDVLIPLFVTTERYHRRVRLFVSDAPEPWLRKYRRFLKIFTEFPVVILGQGEVSWCLSELTVGLEIHGYLTADPEKMPGGVGLARMSELYAEHLEMVNDKPLETQRKLRMGIVHRGGSGRVIENQDRVIQIAEEEGFEVEVLSFSYDSPSLEDVFRTVQGLDVLMGVHGAALTYFVFMQPGTALIQVVPWGVRTVAEVYDGTPAREHGLRYIPYEIEAAESSLLDKYTLDDPVMADTESVWKAGWSEGDRLYLREQNVRLKEERVRRVFQEAKQALLGNGSDGTEMVGRA